jgi:hypothetical protein
VPPPPPPVPFSPSLEGAYAPSVEAVIDAVKSIA